MFSLIDGFSGYSQVIVVEPDQVKTTFKVKWGTFTFKRMSFGLINVGATFPRTMDITFSGLIEHTLVVSLDDVTMFSKRR